VAPDIQTRRTSVIGAALLALFLGALDALIMTAAMPTIVAELGGLHLYSWVYSAYFLARAVCLPIFGKLSDLYGSRRLFLSAIGVFVVASVAAGFAHSMGVLITARAIQGVGAGGIFALVYIVLADVSTPENRGRTLSFASSIWGISSVLGPTLGGFLVSYMSWRWIFFINVPLGFVSFWGVRTHLSDRRKRGGKVSLDIAGVATLTFAIVSFLMAFLLGGRSFPWASVPVVCLFGVSLISTLGFIRVESRARDPILSIGFFRNRAFSTGNGAVFLSSFTIFSLFAFAPLFIQGVQGKSPMEVGVAMLSLSLGWSAGSLALGQMANRTGNRVAAALGGGFLTTGCALTLTFVYETSMLYGFWVFFIVGVGMGFVSLSTLLAVQAGVDKGDLGVATSSHQFARTLGGTVGVGICGSFISNRLLSLQERLEAAGGLKDLPSTASETGYHQLESLLRPDVQAALPPDLRHMVGQSIAEGMNGVFWTATVAAVICMAVCFFVPAGKASS
jgi:EmrB/QacA subfamily drug resistance transporter